MESERTGMVRCQPHRHARNETRHGWKAHCPDTMTTGERPEPQAWYTSVQRVRNQEMKRVSVNLIKL